MGATDFGNASNAMGSGLFGPEAYGAGQAQNGNTTFQKVLDPGGFVFDQSGPVPGAPDFNAAAEAQSASTRPNQYNPFASSEWSQDPTTGKWTQNVSMAGGLGQGVSNLENQIGNQGALGTGDQAREQAINAIYNQSTSRLDPQWKQIQQQQQSQLASQGLDPTSEAYQTQMGNVNRSQTDAYQSAMNNAIQGGTAAQQATFNENLQAQNAPYQQLGQLGQLTQGSSFAQGSPTNYLAGAAAAYGGAMQGYSAKQAGKNSKMQGAASAAPAIAAMF